MELLVCIGLLMFLGAEKELTKRSKNMREFLPLYDRGHEAERVVVLDDEFLECK